ncbi:MAG: hypothetical protein PWR10_1899 [Halanaerobiales bacterium]|nr:hypothetical protein [Halanaerobiales bacterium]
MEKVAIIRSQDYNEERLHRDVRVLLDLLGGVKEFVRPGQRVLLKVNLLMGKPPEAAVTTAPALVKVITRLVQEAGGRVIIGDSPGGPFTVKALKRAYEKSGLARVAAETGAELNYNTGQERVPFAGGRYNKSFVLGKFIREADVIINLPKLKTHGLTMFTGAVKNLFGAIPGLLKAEYHLKMPRIDLFSQMLIDLAFCVKPVLNIMDGIIGMEGEGPSGGSPREFGYLLASPSAVALDVVSALLLGITPLSKAPVIAAAGERGLLASTQLEIVGDKLIPYRDVKIPVIEQKSNLLDQKLPAPVSNLLDKFLRPKPVFNHQKCLGCGDCNRCCPAGVIKMAKGKPVVVLENCIRCFCCQELCQYQAVEIKRPLLGKLVFGNYYK